MEQLLLSLGDPSEVWEEFLFVSSIPRGSGNCEGIAKAIVSRVQKLGLPALIEEETGNVLISRPASPGLEHIPPVCLQAHLDMVCVKDEGIEHDFERDPIALSVRDGVLFAPGTTLGADNGIGLAVGLAIAKASHSDLRCGPIEILFTTDEETTMAGAAGVSPKLLKSKCLINIDSEALGVVTIGSAGGFDARFQTELGKEPVDNKPCLSLSVSGLAGGHSGCEIHKSRANALKLVARLADSLLSLHSDARIVGVVGGSFPNVIPKECTVCVCLDKVECAMEEMTELAKLIKREFTATDPELEVAVDVVEPRTHAFTHEDSRKLIDFLLCLPTGVLRMSPEVSGLVETSLNLASIKMTDNDDVARKAAVEIVVSCRSSKNSALSALQSRLGAFARLSGLSIKNNEDPYPAWTPNPTSPLLQKTLTVAKRVTGEEWHFEAIHAGLECGMFMDKYPFLDAVSIGPNMWDVHSTQERLEIVSVKPFFKIVQELLRECSK